MGTPSLRVVAEEAAVRIAERLPQLDAVPVPMEIAAGGTDARRLWLIRRILEEMGIRCDDSATLQNLKAFLITSPRGVEIVCSRQLSIPERVTAYVHLLAHLLLAPDPGAITVWLEWVDGKRPEKGKRKGEARRKEVLATSLARAILAGQLALAPRYVLSRERPDQRPARRRLRLLSFIHWLSLSMYLRSRLYQDLRARGWMLQLIVRVEHMLEPERAAA